MSLYTERFRECVLAVCKERGLTQEQLADEMGLGRTRFRSYFSRGSLTDPETMLEIANHLGIDLNYLFGRDSTPEWPKKQDLASIIKQLTLIANKHSS